MMKRTLFIAAFLTVALFLQINHVALAHMATTHPVMQMPCGGNSPNTQNADKCVCCLLHQADRTTQIIVLPLFPILTNKFGDPQKLDAHIFSIINPQDRTPEFADTKNRLLTIVQRK